MPKTESNKTENAVKIEPNAVVALYCADIRKFVKRFRTNNSSCTKVSEDKTNNE